MRKTACAIAGLLVFTGCALEELDTVSMAESLFSTDNRPATIYNSGSPEQRFLVGDFDGDGTSDMFQTYRGWSSIPVSVSW